MANLSKASNVVQEKYILYDVTGFTQKWHSIPVATNCKAMALQACVLPPVDSSVPDGVWVRSWTSAQRLLSHG